MEALHPAAQFAAISFIGLGFICLLGLYAITITGRYPWDRRDYD